MKAFIASIAFITMIFSAGSAFAEPPTAPEGDIVMVQPTTDGPKTFKRLVKGAESMFVKKLEMVLYKDKQSGQRATFKVSPLLNPGCKFGLTVNF